ncbi:hypothetical protein SAMN05421788_11849 [Filimonas lacunae]|uniref:Uncharacterized protein n=1 Tax=Filimonas lacunae TaxID=477680 RepID=A0A173MBH0_9BACT|nr:hypothetical protein [Filimonas lacunae]BAV04831.1 hypothetical protein FLA_0830 [Filimonas lacunae]SIT34693.1 hypothetical protein SAMN05421788_11849 [Filimonas lacunae]
MKKFIIAAIAFISMTSMALAAGNNEKTLDLFKASYPEAKKIHYKTVGDLLCVHFVLDSTQMEAFYNEEGEQVAISKVISYQNLPALAISNIENNYSGYTVTEVIEMEHNATGTSYFVSLVNNEQKVITQVSLNGKISLFRKSAR